jgi:hypothetical protein
MRTLQFEGAFAHECGNLSSGWDDPESLPILSQENYECVVKSIHRGTRARYAS